MRTISVIGSVNIDLVVAAERLPAPGETVLGGELRVVPGGKGANQAAAAAHAGARVRFFGTVGRDDHGRLARESLQRCRVDVRGLRSAAQPTGVALIMLDRRGRNLISVAPGANAATRPSGRHDIAVMQLETPYARPRANLLILNPAPAQRVALRGVDVLIPNEHEAHALSGQRDPARAAAVLRRRGARRVLVTLGARGVFDSADERVHRGFRVRVVDTVGAGDAFVGAFAAALAEERADAVRFAQAAAALKCTRPGAQNMPTRREIEEFLR